jgi:predicted permease
MKMLWVLVPALLFVAWINLESDGPHDVTALYVALAIVFGFIGFAPSQFD